MFIFDIIQHFLLIVSRETLCFKSSTHFIPMYKRYHLVSHETLLHLGLILYYIHHFCFTWNIFILHSILCFTWNIVFLVVFSVYRIKERAFCVFLSCFTWNIYRTSLIIILIQCIAKCFVHYINYFTYPTHMLASIYCIRQKKSISVCFSWF